MFTTANIDNWMWWGVILMLGFPLAVTVLSEIAFDLQRSGKTQFLTPLDSFRNSTLFLIFASVLLRYVIGLEPDHLAVRLTDTALWITLINLALALFNSLFFYGAEGTWRAQTPKLLIDLSRLFIVVICAAFVISQIWGIDLKALIAALGVGSLVIGLALQDTLGNLFSGIVMVSARQFKPGDWIKVGDIEGQVQSINWRSVTVGTSTGDLVVIPNGQIARERLRIYGGDKGANAVLIEFKVPNTQAPQPVLDSILSTAGTTNGVLEEPKPAARIVGYDEHNVNYRAILYTRDFARLNAVRTEFLANLWYNLDRAGIPLPQPASVDGLRLPVSAPQTLARHTTPGIVSKLSTAGAFQNSRERLEAIAPQCRLEIYRKGQHLLRNGELSTRFFAMTKGRAAARIVSADKTDLVIEEFGAGELVLYKTFFRKSGCPFDIVATTDVEAVSMPIQTLEGLLSADPELGMEIERLLNLREDAANRIALQNAAQHLNGKADTSRVDILREMFRT